ncbi:MAG: preprotein translocase subunit SecA [Candidatus Gracilibacteria bacterium]|nr:preprotein translocase subunit SecA [Candidatus Gracilibacteria bacterium]
MSTLQKTFEKVFGSYNERQIKALQKQVPPINECEAEMQSWSDEKLKKQFAEWKEELTKHPEKVDEKMVDVFAAVKNVTRRLVGKQFEVRGKKQAWNMIPYDVQLIGGIVLHQGKIAEMKTGEGKTLVCTMPVVLNALTGKGVHVITVNDYLAQRDAEWMKPIYEFCGLKTGVIVHGKDTEERREAYAADITYGTNNEFGFDYLRDNMAQAKEDLVQRDLHYTIVDEVDSILIDEARTPLIISAPAEESTEKYQQYSRLVPQLQENTDFTIDIKLKAVTLTEEGIRKMENFLGVKNIYTEAGFDEVHHIENALKAHIIFERDKDYVVRDDQVLIVDEFTGRLMPGRRYSDGLHQALEAKENVQIQRESKTLATITFQNYFRLYEKLAGMTGTAETEAEEFAKIYKLDTLVIPTNEPIIRNDFPDKIFKNEHGKFLAIAREVEALNQRGQPVLVGTVSIEKSEALSHMLKSNGIRHEVLNAKFHEREAEIVAQAGQKGAVTIATNMAGRGTDIKLGEGVVELGGLAIIGTERHESRRIDNQLRGRAGRQGDPGFTQFFVAMTDDLMRRFGGQRMSGLMQRMGVKDDEAIQNKMISRSVQNAQKKIEAFHFDARKHVVQYDDVMNVHREKMYQRRREILFATTVDEEIEKIAKVFVREIVETHCPHPTVGQEADRAEIAETFRSIFPHPDFEQKEIERFEEREVLIDHIQKTLLESWKKRKKEFPVEDPDDIARYVVLRSFDELWLDHINEMTSLRDRVSLSGYAQKDPIMEYRREGFLMFRRVLFEVRRTALSNLFRVQVAPNFEKETTDYSDAQTNADQIQENLRSGGEAIAQAAAQAGERLSHRSEAPGRSIVAEKLGKKYENIGRNDPCPCGSGKKFKKCHGQNLGVLKASLKADIFCILDQTRLVNISVNFFQFFSDILQDVEKGFQLLHLLICVLIGGKRFARANGFFRRDRSDPVGFECLPVLVGKRKSIECFSLATVSQISRGRSGFFDLLRPVVLKKGCEQVPRLIPDRSCRHQQCQKGDHDHAKFHLRGFWRNEEKLSFQFSSCVSISSKYWEKEENDPVHMPGLRIRSDCQCCVRAVDKISSMSACCKTSLRRINANASSCDGFSRSRETVSDADSYSSIHRRCAGVKGSLRINSDGKACQSFSLKRSTAIPDPPAGICPAPARSGTCENAGMGTGDSQMLALMTSAASGKGFKGSAKRLTSSCNRPAIEGSFLEYGFLGDCFDSDGSNVSSSSAAYSWDSSTGEISFSSAYSAFKSVDFWPNKISSIACKSCTRSNGALDSPSQKSDPTYACSICRSSCRSQSPSPAKTKSRNCWYVINPEVFPGSGE